MAAFARLLALAILMSLSPNAIAQSQSPSTPPQQQTLKAEELDQLVAPIALYPDTLLAEVLMASTYPLEVVQADRWVKQNKSLKGNELKAAVDKQNWEDSIKSLAATPSVLDMMSSKLDWTQKLGDTVLAQQADVMDAVQRLRGKAQAQNKLQSTKEQKVSVRSEQSKQVIVIEPTDPSTMYVPYYDPAVVYGAWPYPQYPPYYWPPPPYIPGGLIATGLAFGAGFALGAWAGNNWGGGMNWSNNNININRNNNVNWNHQVDHRHGVRYNNKDVANKFGRGDKARGNVENRMDFRGRDGQQVLRPGNDRPSGGDRANLGDRGGRDGPGAGDRGRDRPGAGDRSGRDRPSAGTRDRPGAGGGRPAGGRAGGRDTAFSGAGGGGRAAAAQSNRGRASMGGGGGRAAAGGGGRGGGGGGGGGGGRAAAGGGGGRGGGGGGGRRSDIALKHDIVRLGQLENGLGFYRFSYNGSDKAYVGVMAQEVQFTTPEAVTRGRDGYLRVRYDKLGLKFQTYDQWIGSGARVPTTPRTH